MAGGHTCKHVKFSLQKYKNSSSVLHLKHHKGCLFMALFKVSPLLMQIVMLYMEIVVQLAFYSRGL